MTRSTGRTIRVPAQHQTTLYLIANSGAGALTGVAFWLLLVRVLDLPAAEIGTGYAVVAMGTAVGLLATGGLDVALLRNVPTAGGLEGGRLLRFGALIGVASAAALALLFAAAGGFGASLPTMSAGAWILVALIGMLLVVTWLQDAFLVATGAPRATFHRNLVLSGARLALPVPVVALALPQPVPVAWLLALAASAIAAAIYARARPATRGSPMPRKTFLRSALRHMTGRAMQFLPGLLLVPLVLAIQGPAAAGYFGMAWAAASLLFLAAAAIGRSALVELGKRPDRRNPILRRAAWQAVVLLVPGALLGAALAPYILSIFGATYATEAATALWILCLSTFLVAPAYLYLSVLRADERTGPLVAFPLGTLAAMFAMAPVLATQMGLAGAALAWTVANAPFGVWGAWRLTRLLREVEHGAPVGGPADAQ